MGYLNKRNAKATTIGQSIQDLLEFYRLQPKFEATQLTSSWERLMGTPIAKRTGRLFVKEKVMFVELTSAPLKHELTLSKSTVLNVFQEEFGTSCLRDIVFV